MTQTQIKKSVDVESAEKAFELNLPQFGPYTIDYTRNGRFVALGGRKGHVAAIDWQVRLFKFLANYWYLIGNFNPDPFVILVPKAVSKILYLIPNVF